MIDEGIRPEFIAIVNYGIIGLIQLELGYAEKEDITEERALELYDTYADKALKLMLAKNHDYDEAWRSMRITSYTDLILMKIYRTKQIESLKGDTLVSEGVDANYMDMINYAVFGLIKLEFGETSAVFYWLSFFCSPDLLRPMTLWARSIRYRITWKHGGCRA